MSEVEETQELVRKDLVHKHPGMSNEDFFRAIEETGGWPHEYKYVSFYHSFEFNGRYCIFTNHRLNTGWWTTVVTRDDYYWWKLSPEYKKRVTDEARKQLIRLLQ